MAIKQLENGLWLASYSKRPPAGTGVPVTLRRTFKTLAEAKRATPQLIIDVNEKLMRKKIPIWDFVLTEFIESKKEVMCLSTSSNVDSSLRKHSKDWLDLPVDKITKNMLDDLFDFGLTSNTDAHKKFLERYFRAAFDFAVRKNYIQQNPTPLRKYKIKRKMKAVLTESEAGHLLQTANDSNFEWYSIWATAVYTGMRSGELFALRWSNVDIDLRQIKVTDSWNNKNGFKDTKNGRDRITEIPEDLVPVLKELKVKAEWGDFVLPRMTEWERGDQAKILRNFLAAIGLPRIRFHDLRATWTIILLSKGVEPIKVMMMGGWADLETLMLYVRKSGIEIKGATAKLSLHTHNYQNSNVIQMPM